MEARFGNKLVAIMEKEKVLNLSAFLWEYPELLERIPECERILVKVNIPYWITPKGSLTEKTTLIKLISKLKVLRNKPVFLVESRYGWIPFKVEEEYGIPKDEVWDLFFFPSYQVLASALFPDESLVLDISGVVRDPKNFIITLGPPKTHEFVTYTGAVKTCMGFLREKRRHMHGTDDVTVFKRASEDRKLWFKTVSCLQENLVVLQKHIVPDISILDGSSCMEQNGPVFGKEVKWPVFSISNDHVSLDHAMCLLMGLDPDLIYYIWRGMEERKEMKKEIEKMVSPSLDWSEGYISRKGLYRAFERPTNYVDQVNVSLKLKWSSFEANNEGGNKEEGK